MAVVFKGGNSGSRGKDFSPQVPTSGIPQPILRTETHGPTPSSIHFQAENAKANADHYQAQTPDFMPIGAGHAEPRDATHASSDIMDPGATTGGDERVFKGAPNTGTKGGPA